MNFKIAICSYNRRESIEKKTLENLSNHGLYNNIYIFTPDYAEYKDLENEFVKIIKCPRGLVKARNFAMRFFNKGENVLFIDDDIENIICDNNLSFEIDKSFLYMKENNIKLGGINPTGNAYFKTNKTLIGVYFCVGCMYMLINDKFYLDCQDEMEDYERSLKYIERYGKVYRNDKINVKTKFEKNYGGMGMNQCRYPVKSKRSKELFLFYPDLCRLNKKSQYTGLIIKKNTKNIKLVLENTNLNLVGGEKITKPYDINLNIKKNYFFFDTSYNLLGYLLRDKLDVLDFKNTVKINQNRGHIAGVIDIAKLTPCYKKDLKIDSIFNKQKTRVRANKNSFAFCNPVKCISDTIDNIKSNTKDIYNIVASYNYLNIDFNKYIINKNLISANHRDTKNNNPFTCVCMFGQDQIDLVIPEYDLNINIQHGKDILYFDLKNNWHANFSERETVQRYSIIFYNKK